MCEAETFSLCRRQGGRFLNGQAKSRVVRLGNFIISVQLVCGVLPGEFEGRALLKI